VKRGASKLKMTVQDEKDAAKVPRQPLYFLTPDERAFFEALCETIVPSGTDQKVDPGALTVGALSYIDSSLCDSSTETQQYFRRTIELLNKKSLQCFSRNFVDLSSSDQNTLLRDFYLDSTTRERMFDLRSLVLEGFYSDYHDPTYEGITAWELLEFGGKRITELKKDWSFLKVWKDYKQ
jgi:Gluconate 2-dehydrogenase subunit 3